MSVLALTTSLFNAYDTAAMHAQQAARETARAKSRAALSEVKPIDTARSGAHRTPTDKASAPPRDEASSAQVLRRALDAHTIDVDA